MSASSSRKSHRGLPYALEVNDALRKTLDSIRLTVEAEVSRETEEWVKIAAAIDDLCEWPMVQQDREASPLL